MKNFIVLTVLLLDMGVRSRSVNDSFEKIEDAQLEEVLSDENDFSPTTVEPVRRTSSKRPEAVNQSNDIDDDESSEDYDEKVTTRKRTSTTTPRPLRGSSTRRATTTNIMPVTTDTADDESELGTAITRIGLQTTSESTPQTTEEGLPFDKTPLPWPLLSLIKKLKLTPQAFLRDKWVDLKNSLADLGIVLPSNGTDSKLLGSENGLLRLFGLNDGFYTNRLDPAGFFGGNGWFANKGGILGGPGAAFSTGSFLTDYPTPYKK